MVRSGVQPDLHRRDAMRRRWFFDNLVIVLWPSGQKNSRAQIERTTLGACARLFNSRHGVKWPQAGPPTSATAIAQAMARSKAARSC